MALSSLRINLGHLQKLESEIVGIFLNHKKREFGLKVSEVADILNYNPRIVGKVMANSPRFGRITTDRYKLVIDLKSEIRSEGGV